MTSVASRRNTEFMLGTQLVESDTALARFLQRASMDITGGSVKTDPISTRIKLCPEPTRTGHDVGLGAAQLGSSSETALQHSGVPSPL